jgi:hypothetical protein
MIRFEMMRSGLVFLDHNKSGTQIYNDVKQSLPQPVLQLHKGSRLGLAKSRVSPTTGVIDLKDDRDTALSLLGLVNVIAEQMISHSKAIREMYEQLPNDKKQAIEARNERALKDGKPGGPTG